MGGQDRLKKLTRSVAPLRTQLLHAACSGEMVGTVKLPRYAPHPYFLHGFKTSFRQTYISPTTLSHEPRAGLKIAIPAVLMIFI
jgi:hypothetical protein